MYVIHVCQNQKCHYWDGSNFQSAYSFDLMAKSTLFKDGVIQEEIRKARRVAIANNLLGKVTVKNRAGIVVNPFTTVSPEAHLSSTTATEFILALERLGGYYISSIEFVRDSHEFPRKPSEEDRIYTRENLVTGYKDFAGQLRNEEIYADGLILKIIDVVG